MPINFPTSTRFFPWRPACWLRVSGPDAASFLQGQFTQDLRGLASRRAVYGLWLTVKGKVLADSFVLSAGAPDAFWIGSYFSPAEGVRERLESHVIADDVTIADETALWTGLCVIGEAADALLAAAPAGVVAFPGRRGETGAAECLFPVSAGEPEWSAALRATGTLLDEPARERLRIAAGIPAIPVDVGPGDLPNEAGLETVAISYTKGCYLGQEVMARLKSMGQVRRRLLRVRSAAEGPPGRPAPLFVGARQVGELRSAVADGEGGWLGLAMLNLLHVPAGAMLASVADGPATWRVVDAP